MMLSNGVASTKLNLALEFLIVYLLGFHQRRKESSADFFPHFRCATKFTFGRRAKRRGRKLDPEQNPLVVGWMVKGGGDGCNKEEQNGAEFPILCFFSYRHIHRDKRHDISLTNVFLYSKIIQKGDSPYASSWPNDQMKE